MIAHTPLMGELINYFGNLGNNIKILKNHLYSKITYNVF